MWVAGLSQTQLSISDFSISKRFTASFKTRPFLGLFAKGKELELRHLNQGQEPDAKSVSDQRFDVEEDLPLLPWLKSAWNRHVYGTCRCQVAHEFNPGPWSRLGLTSS